MWAAPTVDVWDVVADVLADEPAGLQRVVTGILLQDGGDWVSEEFLNSMHE